MSDLAIIVICLTAVVIAAIFAGTYYSLQKPDPVAEARQRLRVAEDRAVKSLEREERVRRAPIDSRPIEFPQILPAEEEWLEEEPPFVPDSMAPIPVDHDNPPKPLVYNRRGNAPIPNCTCHNRPLKNGQEILWWPVPDSTVVKIFCQRENS